MHITNGIVGHVHMLEYLGTKGYMLNDEQHLDSQYGNKKVLNCFKKYFDSLEELGIVNALSCLDSEHDDAKVIKLHQKQNKHFIIKRNLRDEPKEHWLISARCTGTCQTPREGKNRYIGFASHKKPHGCENSGLIFTVFEVIERTCKANGQALVEPEIEVNTWWTNIREDPETLIQLYYNH